MPFPVQRTHLLGGEGQPVGRRVFAAVSHHKALESPGSTAYSVPGGLREIAHERTPYKAPILFELADKLPPIVTEALQELLRGIPGVKQDKSGLTLEPIARITEQLQSQVVLGGPLCATRGRREACGSGRPSRRGGPLILPRAPCDPYATIPRRPRRGGARRVGRRRWHPRCDTHQPR